MYYHIRGRNHLSTVLIFLSGLLAGIWYLAFGVTHQSLLYIPGDLADARFNNYLLEHAYRYMVGLDESFWNAAFMYPEANVISYSDNLLGSAPFYAIFRSIGFDRETSFQLWYLLMICFNYTGAFFLLKHLCKNSMAAASGAFIFAFSIALQSQVGHAQTFPRFAVPLSLWMAMLFMRELKPRYFLLALLLLVYQFYCGIYLGFLLAVPLMLVLIIGVLYRRGLLLLKMRSLRWWMHMFFSGLLAVLLLIPIMLPYIERSKQIGFYAYEQILLSVPTLKSYLFSRPGTILWEINKELAVEYPSFWDHQIFPGGFAILSAIILVCAAVYTWLSKKKSMWTSLDAPTKSLLIAGLITMILFIKIDGYSLYRFLFSLPGYGSMRALQRIINVELIFFGVATAIVLSAIFKLAGKASVPLFFVIISLLVVDNFAHPDTLHKELKDESLERLSTLIKKIDTSDPQTILSYEPDTLVANQIYFQLDAMLAAQSLGIKTLNGYSATAPVGFDAYWRQPNELTRMIWLKEKKMTMDHVQVIH